MKLNASKFFRDISHVNIANNYNKNDDLFN